MDIRSIILISEDKQTNKEYMAVRETYISRILSALSDGVAKVDEKIKEVISIWICIDARKNEDSIICLLYTSPSPRDKRQSRMPSSA